VVLVMEEHEYDEDDETAEELAEELRLALAVHGIKLPSLGVDPAPSWGVCPYPLVALGNCNLATARQLVGVLTAAAPRAEELGRRVDELNAAVRRHLAGGGG
jgi:hypothetical protein